jgi:hypothetical protein
LIVPTLCVECRSGRSAFRMTQSVIRPVTMQSVGTINPSPVPTPTAFSSFPRSAWECRSRRSASRATQSVIRPVTTQSVGTISHLAVSILPGGRRSVACPAIWRAAAVKPGALVVSDSFVCSGLLPVPGRSPASQLLRLGQHQSDFRALLTHNRQRHPETRAFA